MKVVVITLLVACVLSAQLTPNTKMPPAFDDHIVNSLNGLRNIVPFKGVQTSVSNDISASEYEKIAEFVQERVAWIPASSVAAIVQSSAKLEVNRIESHYVFETSVEKAEIRYAMVNLVKSDRGNYKVQVAHERRPVYGARNNNFLHEVTVSTLGLQVVETKVMSKSGSHLPEFHLANKKRLLSAISSVRGTSMTVALGQTGTSIAEIIGGAKDVVTSIAEGYKSIVDAFKTVKSEEIKEKITGEGFDQYTSRSRYIRSVGIPKTYWETYKVNFMQLTGISKNPIVKPEIETLLKMAAFIQDNAWNTNDLTFDVNTGGTCNNFVCLTRYDSVIQQYHIMATVVDGTFKLAPNMWIYSKYKSVAGGIVETTKLEIKRMPRTLVEADAKAVNAMMLLTSISVMQENFGIPKTLPEFKDML
jgi:hypothetical protein